MLNSTSPHAAVDLGFDGFHMLVIRKMEDSIQTLTKIKHKLRLAISLDRQSMLSQGAIRVDSNAHECSLEDCRTSL